MSSACVFERNTCKKSEKSELVEKYGKYRHRNEEHKYFKRIYRGVGDERFSDCFGLRRRKRENGYGAYEGHYPVCIYLKSEKSDLGKEKD